jgi:hypothetical protein
VFYSHESIGCFIFEKEQREENFLLSHFLCQFVRIESFAIILFNRKSFYALLKVFSIGRIPKDSHLKSIYFTIKQTKCCGFDDNENMIIGEKIFFERLVVDKNCPMHMPGPPYP